MKNLVEMFGRAYLINLAERVDRLQSARRELARVGWDISPGAVRLFSACRFDDAAGFPSAGIRGCFHSHLECLRQAAVGSGKGVVILEDDITFTTSLPRLTPSILSQLDSMEWNIVYFGHEDTGRILRANSRTTPNEFRFDTWAGPILTTPFYGVRSSTLPRLITHLEQILTRPPGDPAGGPMPIDGALNVFRQNNPDVRTLIANPKLGWQRPSRSDLTPRRFDGLTALRPLIEALRALKHATERWRS